MPGVPCLYYGSEWGVKGDKRDGDAALRPCLDAPEWNELTNLISALTRARTGSMALCHGGYRTVVITNRQLVFLREYEGGACALCGESGRRAQHRQSRRVRRKGHGFDFRGNGGTGAESDIGALLGKKKFGAWGRNCGI